MNLDRLDFEAMITFISAAIQKDGEDSCLFIMVKNDDVICTGGTENLAKLAPLTKHADIEEGSKNKKPTPKEFMIPTGALLSFKKLMDEHKAKCKKLAKGDPSYLFVQITDKKLSSNGVDIIYEQPSIKFKNLEPLFKQKKEEISELFLYSSELSSIMTGFEKSKQIKTTFCGDTVHFYQKSSGYEAFFIPPVEEADPPMGGDED